MRVPLSRYIAANRRHFRRSVNELQSEYPFVSLLVTDCFGTRCEARQGEVSVRDSRWNERGCVVRVHDGVGYREVSFNRPPVPAELRALLTGGGRGPVPAGKRLAYPVPRLEPLRRRWQGQVGRLPARVSLQNRVGRLTALRERAFSLCPSLVDIRVIYEEVTVCKLFLSAGRELEQAYHWSQGYLYPVVRRDGVTRYANELFSGLKGVELLDEMEVALPKALETAVELLAAGRVQPGEYEVILAPEIAGLLAHEAFGHGVELDMFVKGRARAAAYLGRPVASELVSLRDGARAAAQVGSYWFDDEGVLGGDTVIVERGVFRAGISDLLSAQRLGTPPTGHGRRESFERKAYARMANTFFSGGNDRLEDMIASIRQGYLLEKFESGMEDPRGWGLQGIVLYGREIAAGRLTGRLVAPVIMTGYVPDVLGSVSAASGQVVMSGTGMCGKGHKEYVKNSMGGPYLKCRLRLG